jgi:phosphoenolpyruvate phosphomutase
MTDPASVGINGEWTGLLKLSAEGARTVRAMLDAWPKAELDRASMPDLLRRLVREDKHVRVVYTRGGWLDVNTLSDLVQGSAFQ